MLTDMSMHLRAEDTYKPHLEMNCAVPSEPTPVLHLPYWPGSALSVFFADVDQVRVLQNALTDFLDRHEAETARLAQALSDAERMLRADESTKRENDWREDFETRR